MPNNKPKIDFRAANAKKREHAKATANAQIERINELSKMARGTWFSLLGYLAFVGVTLLAVQDADFFVSTRKTQLPIVNIPIPTASFFILGPILGTALFVYLHLYLIRLWDALSEAPEKIGDTPLSEKVMPWLINDFGLWLRRDDAFKGRPMDWVSHTVTFTLVFAAAPFIMAAFWVRHWPSHAALLNGFLALLFAFTLITTLSSFHTAYHRLRKREGYPKKPNHMLALGTFFGICFITLGMTAIKAEGIITEQEASDDPPQNAIYSYYDTNLPTGLNSLWKLSTAEFTLWSKSRRPFALAHANLEENDLVGRPANWLEYNDQKRAFRKEFCKGEGLPPAVCGPILEAGKKIASVQEVARENWANKIKLDADKADKYFASLDNQFQSDWKIEYKARTSALPKLNLQDRDLRNAFANQVFLSGADMSGAELDGADLTGAELQGADLNRARLQGAYLGNAELQGVDLSKANLQEASLYDAELQEADLTGAELQGADLSGAELQGADLIGAKLQGADLSDAELQEADVTGANLQGADLSGAELQGANLSDTKFQEADLSDTKFQGADLTGAELQGANLRGANMQGADLRRAELQGAYLGRVNLQEADLGRAKLQKADLRGTNLQGADLFDANLQEANLGSANLQEANLGNANFQGADLVDAKLQGADISGAKLQGADLRQANLQGTDLRRTNLQGANLRGALLQEADLGDADLQGADLRGAKLQGADLRSAMLQSAYLSRAGLQGVDLRHAGLQEADLRSVNLKSVEWAGATLHSLAHSTDLRGSVGLTQDMLENVIGDKDTLLFASEGYALHVWSCWLPDNLPLNLDQLLEQNVFGETKEERRAKWVCSDENSRVKTGTTKPLDAE